MIFRNIRPVKVNNGRWAAIRNFIDLKFFKMHPLLKPYNLFYSNGAAILSGFHDIPQNISVGLKCWVNFKVKVQKPEKAQLETLENMYVQYDCNRPSTCRDLLRKRCVRQNV